VGWGLFSGEVRKQRVFSASCNRLPENPVRSITLVLITFALGAANAEDQQQTPTTTPDPEAGESNDTIIVTADRRETTLERTTASVEVIDDEDLHTRGDPIHAHDALRRLPGVYVQQSGGGFGGTADISIRGTRNHETQLLIDGIPFNDPGAPVGAPDVLFFNPAGLTRIDLVKGAQGGLYGSRAVGGVINFITAEPTPDHRGSAMLEGGSFETFRAETDASGPINEHLGYALGISGVTSDGFSVQTSPGAGGDPDGHEDDSFERWGINGRLQAHNDIAKAYLALNTVTLEEDLDFTGPDDLVNTIEVQGYRTSTGARTKLSEDVEIAGDVAYSIFDHEYPQETSFDKESDSDEWYGSMRAGYNVIRPLTVTLGVDGDWQHADISAATAENFDRRASLIGVWVEGMYSVPSAELSLAVRRDEHSREGDATTFRAGAAGFLCDNAVKVFSSVATGFRAPSIYELYDTTFASGNPDLRPQETISYEIGHRSRVFDGIDLTNTWFRTEYRDAIVYDIATGKNGNVTTDSHVDGIENSLEFQDDNCPVEMRLTYTWQDSDDGAGNNLRFIPENLASMDITYRYRQAWTRVAAERVWSRTTGLADPMKLDAYSLLSLVIGWEFARGWEAHVRAENLTDEEYEYYPGYSTARRSAYVGITANF
jgi:vitamin B12 transporter